MKVLFVSNLYPPAVSCGCGLVCEQVVDRFKGLGHSVQIVTSNYQSDQYVFDRNVHRILQLIPAHQQDQTGEISLSITDRIARTNSQRLFSFLTVYQPDVVLCWCLDRMSLGPVFAAQELNIPVCYFVCDDHPKQFWMDSKRRDFKHLARSFIEQYIYPMATFRNVEQFPVACTSHALKKRLFQKNTPLEYTEVIQDGFSVDSYNRGYSLDLFSDRLNAFVYKTADA